jgi:membrane protein implicated in regulation of membrane protease activity
LRYTLLQAPDVALAALVVWALWNWMLVPGWVALAGLALWIAKDVAIYPLVRRSFSLGESEWVGIRPLIGARGIATEDLSPSGWVRVKGELWRARAKEDAPVAGGTYVRVREVRGMTLLIESDYGPSVLKQSTGADVEPADGDGCAPD